MLAAIRFLQHQTCEWNGTWPTINKNITVYSDNLSLIQRISWHKKRIVVTPKNVSAANYNTKKSITSTIDYLETKRIIIQVCHIKGQQDKKHQKQEQPKEAHMNVKADIESTKRWKRTQTYKNIIRCQRQEQCSTSKDNQ
jgi:hypothetical protein